MDYDFDQRIERRQFGSNKWHRYDEDVLPPWLADMDFPAPKPIIRALQERVQHGAHGYGQVPDELLEGMRQALIGLSTKREPPQGLRGT